MKSKESGETQEKELLERYRRASDREASAPSALVRAAILAESRRVAEQLAQQASNAQQKSQPVFDTSRPAANDSRWKITAFGTLGAALLAALIFAPRYWETLPAPKAESVSPGASSNAMQDVVVTGARRGAADAQAQTAAKSAPSNAPAREASPLAAPAPILEQRYSASKDAARTPEPFADASPLAPSAPSANSSHSESADRMFKRAQTPATLQSAAKSGDAILAAKLLDEGAAVNARDAHGRTPLMLAVEQGQLDVVRLLLQRGADRNATDDTGRTPLQKAQLQNLKEIETLLEGAGAH